MLNVPSLASSLRRTLTASTALALTLGVTTGQGFTPPQPGFVANQGQWSSPELYRLQVAGLEMFFEESGWSFWAREPDGSGVPAGARSGTRTPETDLSRGTARATALRMRFVDAADVRIVPEQEQRGRHNFLLGAAEQHRQDVPAYAALRYTNVRPGIDVRARTHGGHFEYDLLVEPGATLESAVIEIDGLSAPLEIDAAGQLVLHTAVGDLTQPRPTTWMVLDDGSTEPVVCDYVLEGEGRFAFTAPERQTNRALVVDPPLLFSSYVGGSVYDEPSWISIDSQGRTLFAGYTESANFPTSTGALQTVYGGTADGFLMCVDPNLPPANQVIFATYFGGGGNDWTSSICELPGVGIAFAGRTASSGLPTTPGAFQPNLRSAPDGFVGVLDPTGANLLALTYFGGTGPDLCFSVHAHPNGNLVVSGITLSSDLPTTPNGEQPNYMGGPVAGQDIYLAMLDPNLSSLAWSTYAGGTGDDWGYAADMNSQGHVVIALGTGSPDIPTTPTAVSPTFNGGFVTTQFRSADAGVMVYDPLRAPGQQILYASYLGGTWNEQTFRARFAPGGDLLLSGTAQSRDFPTTSDSFQPNHAGGSFINSNYVAGDAFATRIDPNVAGMAGIEWSTLLGGPDQDQGIDMDIADDGTVILVGWSRITRNVWPSTPNALRRTYGQNDGWAAHLSADGRQLYYSTLLGGTALSDGTWLAEQTGPGLAMLGTATSSNNFPVVNGFQAAHGGGADAALTLFDFVPDGTTRYGAPTRGAAGYPTIHAMGDAVPGNASFGLACSRAAPSAPGVLILSAASLNGVPLLGIDLYVNQSTGIALTVGSDARGEHAVTLALPTTPIGTLYAQYVWVENVSPLTLSASDALQF